MIGNDIMRWKWKESLHSLRSVFNGEFSNTIDCLKHKAAVVYCFPRRIKSNRLARINQIVYTPINNYSFVCLLLLHGRPVGQVLNLFSPAIAFCLASFFFFLWALIPDYQGWRSSFISGSRHSHVATLFLDSVFCEKSFTKQMTISTN